jgi:peptidyl-prolyl cis-trans isomerase C
MRVRSRKISMLFAGVALSTSLLLSACGKDEGTGKVIATVNGTAIRESSVDNQISQLPPQLVQGHEAEIRRQLVDRLVEQQLIQQEAAKQNIASDPAYKKQLDAMTQQLQANFLLQKKIDSTLTQAVLKQAYEATKAQRAFPAVRARHILVNTEAEANQLIAIATPSNFAELAKEKSMGPSKDNGGELGWFRREAMVPEFAAVAFSTPVGTVARTPVKTQFGWHVILVEDKNDKYIPPFEQVEGSLKQELSQQVAQGYLAELRKNATVNYTDPAMVAPAEGTTAQQQAPAATPASAPAAK